MFVDMSSDIVLFRHQLQPGGNSGRGFILKDVPSTKYDAAWTGYIDGTPEYYESIYKSDGFSSRVYGILPTETVPSTEDYLGVIGTTGSANILPAQEYAQKFRPPHSHFLPGDIIIAGGEICSTANTKSWIPRFRIWTHTGGLPTNVGGIGGIEDL